MNVRLLALKCAPGGRVYALKVKGSLSGSDAVIWKDVVAVWITDWSEMEVKVGGWLCSSPAS